MGEQVRQVVVSDRAPSAIGPYSQAVKANGLVYTAGQIPVDPATKRVVEGNIATQADRVLQNLEAILTASGSSLDRVLKTTCFLTNLDDFPAFNDVYGRYFPTDAPARSTVEVSRLPLGALVEVECVALTE